MENCTKGSYNVHVGEVKIPIDNNIMIREDLS
jgi:hypothetical protein